MRSFLATGSTLTNRSTRPTTQTSSSHVVHTTSAVSIIGCNSINSAGLSSITATAPVVTSPSGHASISAGLSSITATASAVTGPSDPAFIPVEVSLEPAPVSTSLTTTFVNPIYSAPTFATGSQQRNISTNNPRGRGMGRGRGRGRASNVEHLLTRSGSVGLQNFYGNLEIENFSSNDFNDVFTMNPGNTYEGFADTIPEPNETIT